LALVFKKNSITLRLCLLISTGMFVILLVISCSLFLLLKKNFQTSASEFLRNEISIISDILQKHTIDWTALDQEVIWEPQSSRYEYLVNVSSLDKHFVKATPTFYRLFSGTSWPVVTDPSSQASTIEKIKIAKKTYALMTTIIKLAKPQQQTYVIRVAYDISLDEGILKEIRQSLFFITLIGLFISIIGSFILIKVGLKPLSLFVNSILKMDVKALTERLDIKKASEELEPLIGAFNHLLDKIQEGYEKLSDFSSNIAHELRTPINNLMVETEVLLTQPLSSPKIKDLLGSSLEEYQRLANIIDKLLFLARSDAKKIHMNKTELNAYNEIKAVVDFHEAIAAEQNISIEIIGNANLMADQTLFRNALANILTNAIKYTGKNSCIVIKTISHIDSINITIADNGPGIPTSHFQKLSERFYRIDTHRSANAGGSGLGLAIVNSIMKAHFGKLEFYENIPTGMIISLFFPK